jgi:transcriptional regulator of arginine metabolism
MNKRERHRMILELVASRPIASQEELREHLAARGLTVTQSTLSRDLRELRLARIPTPDGVRYANPEAGSESTNRPGLEDVLPQFFESVDGVRELLVVRTTAGGAQPTAEALDAAELPEVVGTVAGENTVLVVCRSSAARERLARRLERLGRQRLE